ncbi:MAG: hypothetical protein HZC40_11730 [Chloroflexi bacterium]|nr:hypothetical protein [Chloroflexota bacterium]
MKNFIRVLIFAAGVALSACNSTRAPQPISIANPTILPRVPANAPATPALPQLGVFDQGGGAFDLFLFGGQSGTRLVFRVIACSPNCNNRPDGRDVVAVKFAILRVTAQGQPGDLVFEHTETQSPFCAFGGTGACDALSIAERNAKWLATNTVIENADYILRVTAADKNSGAWDGRFKFTVRR